jgi:hypothetical protein
MSVANGFHGRRGATPPGGATTFDLFSWSDTPDATDRSRAPVRHTATNDSNAFLSAVDQRTSTTTGDYSPVARPAIRMQQPAGGISTITFSEAQLSSEEADALLKKKRPASDLKRREMYGSGIFPACGHDGGEAAASNGGTTTSSTPAVLDMMRTSVRCHQPAGGVSQISFGGDHNSVSPKKPVTVPEVAKQKELSGTVETTDDLAARRVCSNAKSKELIGSKIFAPTFDSPKLPSRLGGDQEKLISREEYTKGLLEDGSTAAGGNVLLHTSVKVSNPAGGRCQISFGPEIDETTSDLIARKLHDNKMAELSGHGIFIDSDHQLGPAHHHHKLMASDSKSSLLHHQLSKAKLKEISGSDIFSDDKPAARDLIGGIRKPPGGGSTISLQ